MNKRRFFFGVFAVYFLTVLPGHAADFYCEVMALEGQATVSNTEIAGQALSEGDTLKVDDILQVGSGSTVDLAYDKEWNNITRVEENSTVRIRSLYPTVLALDKGGIYSKLKQLPKESSFEVQTPTAIASVRGTEYRTTFLEGQTQIYNVSDSDVYVYGLDEKGVKQTEPMVLKNSQKTQILNIGARPIAARVMEGGDFHPMQRARERIDRRINENIAQGRFAKLKDIKQIENAHRPGPEGSKQNMIRDEDIFKSKRPGTAPENQAQQRVAHSVQSGREEIKKPQARKQDNRNTAPSTDGRNVFRSDERSPRNEPSERNEPNPRTERSEPGERWGIHANQNVNQTNKRNQGNVGNGMTPQPRPADDMAKNSPGQPFGPDSGRRPKENVSGGGNSQNSMNSPGGPPAQSGQTNKSNNQGNKPNNQNQQSGRPGGPPPGGGGPPHR